MTVTWSEVVGLAGWVIVLRHPECVLDVHDGHGRAFGSLEALDRHPMRAESDDMLAYPVTCESASAAPQPSQRRTGCGGLVPGGEVREPARLTLTL